MQYAKIVVRKQKRLMHFLSWPDFDFAFSIEAEEEQGLSLTRVYLFEQEASGKQDRSLEICWMNRLVAPPRISMYR